MGLKVGDRLQLVSPVSIATPLGVMPRSAVAEVTAVFCAGMYDYDSNFVYRAARRGAAPARHGRQVSTLEVFPRRGHAGAPGARAARPGVGLQGWVFDWYQANFGFFAAIQGQTNVLFIVLTMIVLVAPSTSCRAW
jgi:lipoprotein-releasing system permease protein